MTGEIAGSGRGVTVADASSRLPGLLDFAQENPFRGVDWRWRLAQLSLREDLPDRPETRDPWVRRIRGYLLALRRAGRAGGRAAGRLLDRHIREAALLHASQDPHRRGELEAWILTGEPVASIAGRCGIEADVVEAYEACFFDVRPHLDAEMRILHTVLGRQISRGFAYGDVVSIWKLVAYLRGRYCLEALLYVFPGPRARPWPASIPATGAERRRLVEACRKLVLTRWLRPGADIAVRLFLLACRLRAAAASTGSPDPAAPARPVELAVDLGDPGRERPGSSARRGNASLVDAPPAEATGAVAPATTGPDLPLSRAV